VDIKLLRNIRDKQEGLSGIKNEIFRKLESKICQQLKEKLLQCFGCTRRLNRMRLLRRAVELKYKGLRPV
jgi:hypothetical protein